MEDTKLIRRRNHCVRTRPCSAIIKSESNDSNDSDIEESSIVCPVMKKSVVQETNPLKRKVIRRSNTKKTTQPVVKKSNSKTVYGNSEKYKKYGIGDGEDDGTTDGGNNDGDGDTKQEKIIVDRTEIFDEYTIELSNEVPGKEIIPKLMKYVFPECNSDDIYINGVLDNGPQVLPLDNCEYVGYYGITKFDVTENGTSTEKKYKAFATGILMKQKIQYDSGAINRTIEKAYNFIASNKHISIYEIDTTQITEIETTTKCCVLTGKLNEETGVVDKIAIGTFKVSETDEKEKKQVIIPYKNNMLIVVWNKENMFDVQDDQTVFPIVDGTFCSYSSPDLDFSVGKKKRVVQSTKGSKSRKSNGSQQQSKSRMGVKRKVEELRALHKSLTK